MRIGLDYDDTFTVDPVAWSEVVAVLQSRGHEVVCVSARYKCFENQRELEDAIPPGVDVVLCSMNAKLDVMRKRGTPVDVWIDDNPYTIDPDGMR